MGSCYWGTQIFTHREVEYWQHFAAQDRWLGGIGVCYLMSVRLWNFKDGGVLNARFMPKNQRAKRNFDDKILRLMPVRQKVPKSYFQSQFFM